jgi:uncharacterized protein
MEKTWVFVVLLVAFLSIGAYVVVNNPVERQIINVNGNAEIETMPDFVSVYISIETLAESAEDSKNQNAEISKEVMQALREMNFQDSEIETVSWNIYEDYDWTSDGRKFRGYKTVNSLKVEVEEYDFVGTVVDRVVDEGAIIRSLNFEISKETENELKKQAIEEATKDAKEKAEAVASGTGQRLGKLVSVSVNDYYYQGYPLYDYSAEGSEGLKDATTQISPRELTVNANVRAVYQVR